MAHALNVSVAVAFETIECYRCGVIFAITTDLKRNLQKTTNQFFCPNGHGQSYTESTETKLRRELEEKTRALDWEKQRAASLATQLTKATKAADRLKRRVANGVCPCCQRTVRQLARHMATKHPDYVKESAAP